MNYNSEMCPCGQSAVWKQTCAVHGEAVEALKSRTVVALTKSGDLHSETDPRILLGELMLALSREG